jgi:PAS domain S-box-containing protein
MNIEIDIHTLAIVLSLINFLQVIALYIQYRLEKNRSGPGWWILGNTAVALGFVFNYVRDNPTFGLIAIVANNVLFVSGMLLLYVGILRFFDQREQRGWLITFCALFTLAIIYFTYLNDDLAARRVLLSSAIAAISFLITWSLFKHTVRSVTASAHFLAVVFLATGIFFVMRMLSAFSGAPLGDIFTPTVTQTATYLFILIASTLWTFGLIIFVNQRLSEESREVSENQELIFNTSPDAVLITRLADGLFVGINDGFSVLTGFTRAEVIGRSILEVNIWKNPEDRQQLVNLLLEKGVCENLEAVFQRKNGSQMIGMVFAKIITLQGVAHIVSVTHDITERKQAEDALRESEEKFRELANLLPQTIFESDTQGNLTYVNKQAYGIFGYTENDSMIGVNTLNFYTPESKIRAIENIKRRISGEPMGSNEYTMLRKDGSTFKALVYSNSIWKEKKPVGLRGIIVDITELRHAEESLRERDEQHRTILQAALDGFWMSDMQGRLLEVNDSYCQMSGYDASELLTMRISDLESVETEQEISAHLQMIKTHGESRFESRHRRKDGSIFNVEISVQYRADEGGRCIAFLRDITERKQAEERTQTLMERWSIVYRAGEEIGASLDTEQVFRAVYHAVGQVMPSEDFLISLYDENRNLLWGDYIIENGIRVSSNSHQYENKKKIAPNPQLADLGLGGFIIHSGLSVLLNSPEQINASGIKFLPYGSGAPTSSVLAVPIQLKGKMLGIISAQSYQSGAYTPEDQELLEMLASHAAIAIDNASLFERAQQEIVERVQAEEEVRQLNFTLEKRIKERTRELSDAQEQLVRHEKLSVLGQMASSVGHELRNPLGVITSAIYYLKLVQPDANEKIKQYLGIIEQEVQTSEKIITDLLDFARIKSVDREPVAVSELVNQTLARFPVPNTVDVTIEIPNDLPQVFVDPRQIVQVLGNIILNACQAMASPAGDSASTNGVQKYGLLSLHANLQGDMINIVVKDDGVGIPTDNIQKIFEPLFTTKAKGVGLGLPVSQKLAQANGGSIEVQSEAGNGSSFNVFLPIYKEAK